MDIIQHRNAIIDDSIQLKYLEMLEAHREYERVRGELYNLMVKEIKTLHEANGEQRKRYWELFSQCINIGKNE